MRPTQTKINVRLHVRDSEYVCSRCIDSTDPRSSKIWECLNRKVTEKVGESGQVWVVAMSELEIFPHVDREVVEDDTNVLE